MNKQRGATLVEFLIILTIIAIIFAIAIPNLLMARESGAKVRKDAQAREEKEAFIQKVCGEGTILSEIDFGDLSERPTLRRGGFQEVNLATAKAIVEKCGGDTLIVLKKPDEDVYRLAVINNKDKKLIATGLSPGVNKEVVDSMKMEPGEKVQ